MIPTKASYLLAALIPSAQIHVYPDASHGSIFQYAEDAANRTVEFLSANPGPGEHAGGA